MIVIESIQSIGPWGISKALDSPLKKQLFENDFSKLPWQHSRKSLEEQILTDSIDGCINHNNLDDELQKTIKTKHLPRDTQFAIQLLKHLPQLKKSGLVCAVSHSENPRDQEIFFEQKSPPRLRQKNPRTNIDPHYFLKNSQNQFMANIAIYFGLHGDSVNLCGPNSSYDAIESAFRSISSGLDDEIIFAGSFTYNPAIISLQLSTIIQSASDFFKLNQVSFNEWIGVTRLKKSNKIKPNEIAILALDRSRLDICSNVESQIFEAIEKIVKIANKTIRQIDMILINDPLNIWLLEHLTTLNFFQPEIKIIDFYERLGNSLHCTFIQCLEFAQMIFDNNQIPTRIRNDFRQNTNLFQTIEDNSRFEGQCALIICSNSIDELHMGLIERYSDDA